MSDQMALIRKADHAGDIRRGVAGTQEPARVEDAHQELIRVRRVADFVSEAANQAVLVKVHERCQLFEGHAARVACIEVVLGPADRREPIPALSITFVLGMQLQKLGQPLPSRITLARQVDPDSLRRLISHRKVLQVERHLADAWMRKDGLPRICSPTRPIDAAKIRAEDVEPPPQVEQDAVVRIGGDAGFEIAHQTKGLMLPVHDQFPDVRLGKQEHVDVAAQGWHEVAAIDGFSRQVPREDVSPVADQIRRVGRYGIDHARDLRGHRFDCTCHLDVLCHRGEIEEFASADDINIECVADPPKNDGRKADFAPGFQPRVPRGPDPRRARPPRRSQDPERVWPWRARRPALFGSLGHCRTVPARCSHAQRSSRQPDGHCGDRVARSPARYVEHDPHECHSVSG
jgi:hypothetical protein